MDINSLAPTIGGAAADLANAKNVIIPGNVYQMQGRYQRGHYDFSEDMEATWRIYDRAGFTEAIAAHIEYHGIDKSAEYLADQIFDIYGWRDQVYYALPTIMLSSWAFIAFDMYGQSIYCGSYTSPDNLWNLVTGPQF